MHAGRHASGYRFAGEDGAERQTSGQRLGDENNVRLGRKFLVGEVTAGTAEAALNFVGDKQRAVLRGQGASTIPKRFAGGIDAAFTLDGFEDHGADGVVKFGFEIGNVVETDKFDAGHYGREGQAIFLRGGDADGAEGAA